MERGYLSAVEALGEMILEQKQQIKYKQYDIEHKNKVIAEQQKELIKLKEKIDLLDQYIQGYSTS